MVEKPKRKTKNRISNKKIVIGLAVFLGFVFSSLVLLMLWLGSALSADEEFSGKEAITQIEDFLDYSLPESSQNVFFYKVTFEDHQFPAARIRFTAKTDEVELWLQNPYFCFKDPLPDKQIFSAELDYDKILDHDWWNPYAMDTFIGDFCYDGRHTYPYASHQIQIDTSNSEYWTVYFQFWFY